MRTGRPRIPIATRFWMKVRKTERDGCWIWTGALSKGYGAIRLPGQGGGQTSASRVAYLLSYGDIPAGKHVCHRCDNPPCVRPDHLFLGTPTDNVRDCILKGRRIQVGERNGSARLTNNEVKGMRRDYGTGRFTYKMLASKYAVCWSTVQKIISGHRWKHV